MLNKIILTLDYLVSNPLRWRSIISKLAKSLINTWMLCFYFDRELCWHNYCTVLNTIIMTLECLVSFVYFACDSKWIYIDAHTLNRRYITFENYLMKITHRKIFSKSYWINLKLDCIYHFPINLEPNGHPFRFISIGKW